MISSGLTVLPLLVQNMGLYGQRVGTFSLVAADPEEAKKVESQMKVSCCQISSCR